MHLNAYLHFKGDCEAAFKFYEQCLGGKIEAMTPYDGSPAQTKDPAEAERVFRALVEKGQVKMPIRETFWAARFGTCVDRFGIPWLVNCDKGA